jgi:hypothetical protein
VDRYIALVQEFPGHVDAIMLNARLYSSFKIECYKGLALQSQKDLSLRFELIDKEDVGNNEFLISIDTYIASLSGSLKKTLENPQSSSSILITEQYARFVKRYSEYFLGDYLRAHHANDNKTRYRA